MFYGRGAGGAPTASAVLGDTVAAARNRVLGGKGPSESAHAGRPLLSVDQAQTNYQIRLDVVDKPGVLAAIAGVFAQRDISIEHAPGAERGYYRVGDHHPLRCRPSPARHYYCFGTA